MARGKPSDDLPPPHLVQDEDGFGRLIDALDSAAELAVDTEADSFYSYRDKVCLFQVTVGDEDWLVDPLAGIDLTPFGEVLADPLKTKVFHDAEYDVLILKRDFGFTFSSLFDTRVAAAVLGSRSPGLASVLEERFDVLLDKSQQRSNWARRPLSKEQIAYARLDTRFLIPLMHQQKEELDERNRRMIVDAECRRLEAIVPGEQEFDADEFVRIKGARSLDGKGARALRELFALREDLAKKHDTPPFRILNNRTLLALASERPRGSKELLRIEGITQKVVQRMGDKIARALRRAGDKGPLDRLPVLRRRDGTADLSEIEIELYERLKRCRKSAAEREGVESSYLLNRHVMVRLAQERPADLEALRATDGIEAWQVDLLGKKLVDTVARFEDDVSAGTVPGRRPWRR